MTLFKLSMRNIRKSMKDYVVYFATLILGVAMFYVFNAIEKQSAMLTLANSGYDVIDTMFDIMSIIGVFVAFVLGFLVVYASSFLMKRRKKEFAVYMLLGMNKRKISAIIVIETVLIGIISLGVGLLLGIGVSQGMSVIVANLFEADMTSFRFVVSEDAILKTLLYFVIMYFLVIMFDVFVVGKARLINLLNAGRHTEKNFAKNPFLCILVFAVAAFLLGTAYYKVTAGITEIEKMGELGTQVIKGIIGTFLAFWSVSGLLIFFIQKNKRFYYKKIHCFTTKELGSRINSNVFSGGIICLLLFLTITVLSCSIAVRNGMNKTFNKNAQSDVMIGQTTHRGTHKPEKSSVISLLEEKKVDLDKFSDYDEIYVYVFEDVTLESLVGTDNEMVFYSYAEVVKLSDYNRIAKLYGRDELSLNDDEYIFMSNFKMNVDACNKQLKAGKTIDVCGKTYKPKYDRCIELGLFMSNTESNSGTIIVPDSCAFEAYEEDVVFLETLFIANYDKDMSKKELEEWDDYLAGKEFRDLLNQDEDDNRPYADVATKSYLRATAVGLSAVTIFMGMYVGLVFLISAAALLSLKELSSAADNKEKYAVLRKIGVDEKMLNHSLMSQSLIFFGLPLVLAIVHSIFGIQTGMFVLASFSYAGVKGGIMLASGMILLIYAIYFMITYYCSKEIIKE